MADTVTLRLIANGFDKVVYIDTKNISIERFEEIIDVAKGNLFRAFLKHDHGMKSIPIDRSAYINRKSVRERIESLEAFEKSLPDE